MLVAPPPRFSTTTCWPHSSDSFPATMRAIASVPPPGGNGTIMRTNRFGHASARAGRMARAGATVDAAASTTRRRRSIIAARSPVDLDIGLADQRPPLVHLGLQMAGKLVRGRADDRGAER